jgi:hypothetical protein
MIILNDLDNLIGLEIFSKYTPELKFEISISELNSVALVENAYL